MALAPKDQAWSILLRELPQYLARPTERRPGDIGTFGYHRVWIDSRAQMHWLDTQARDLVALVLAQKPHAPDACKSHSKAEKLLLRMALVHAWVAGKGLAHRMRETYMGRRGRRLTGIRRSSFQSKRLARRSGTPQGPGTAPCRTGTCAGDFAEPVGGYS